MLVRAPCALQHLKEGDYEVRVASLSDKPQWFTDIYRKAIGSDQTSTGESSQALGLPLARLGMCGQGGLVAQASHRRAGG